MIRQELLPEMSAKALDRDFAPTLDLHDIKYSLESVHFPLQVHKASCRGFLALAGLRLLWRDQPKEDCRKAESPRTSMVRPHSNYNSNERSSTQYIEMIC